MEMQAQHGPDQRDKPRAGTNRRQPIRLNSSIWKSRITWTTSGWEISGSRRGHGGTERVVERGTRRDEERKQGVKTLGEARVRNQYSRMNLKLSFKGSVEMQAQNWSDLLDKLRAGSDEDRSVRPRLAKEAREPDPRGANRVLEAYVAIFSR